MPSVEWNRQTWSGRHGWERQGDEWTGMADHCGQPYEDWKQSLVDTFIVELVPVGAEVVEIAPGHGRWTEHLLARAKHVDAVDINQSCLDVCAQRFAAADNLALRLTDGSSMSFVADGSVDVVWSFDSFVHMEPEVIQGYLTEFARVIRPGGRAVIHHAGLRPWSLPLARLTRRLGQPGRVVQRWAGQGRWRDSGHRSAVSAPAVARWAVGAGLEVERQTQTWGPQGQFDVRKYGDWITIARQPSPRRAH